MAAEPAVPLVARLRLAAPARGALRRSRRGRDLAGAQPSQGVRSLFVENATRVVLVHDRRVSMAPFPRRSRSLFKAWYPKVRFSQAWFSKPQACGTAGRLLAASAQRARCAFREADDDLAHALEALAIGRLGKGSFVFLISDFRDLPPEALWREVLERGWDIVPVVLEDTVSARSFPLFDRLGLDCVQLAHHDEASVRRGFHEWSEARRAGTRGRP
ncbi:MAG: hypothetical protein QOH16_1642 [Gaiellaceae bacterium]|nr:hypothetical protein [Gaiellaceae bacterium]